MTVFNGPIVAAIIREHGAMAIHPIHPPVGGLFELAARIERSGANHWCVSAIWVDPECLPPHMQRPDLKARHMHYAKQGYWLAAWLRNLAAASAH